MIENNKTKQTNNYQPGKKGTLGKRDEQKA